MIAKAKHYREVFKTSVSLVLTGCLWGRPGRREHKSKRPPPDDVHQVKRVH